MSAVWPVVGCTVAATAYFAWRGFWPMVAFGAVGAAGWLWVASRG